VLTEGARRLVESAVDSVGRLDVLALLHADPQVAWSAAGVAKRMRTSRRWAKAQLKALEEAGLLREREGGTWSYDPADAKRGAAEDLMTADAQDHPAVVAAIFATRPAGAQAFSDAFRLRRPR
jgi:hypothetical protein